MSSVTSVASSKATFTQSAAPVEAFSIPLNTPDGKVFGIVIEAVQAGRISPDAASAAIDAYRAAKECAGRKPRFRRTVKGTLWLGLPYKATTGMSASVCLPRKGWDILVALAKDGTPEKTLAAWDTIPLSAAAKGDNAE